jgi:CheY-like chemotaxis protein
MKMPGMNGIDTVVMLRENGAQVPIIALTAFAYDDDRALHSMWAAMTF